MKKELTKKQIMDLPKYCTNLKIGGSCYAFCPYRENGCCELDPVEVLTLAIKYLNENHLQSE